ncbi:hypothetical protein KBD20_04650 [Candidatus Saccharibacteria bacterium]|nr:hypothetical protein [Candidatus Saccharibacteria bacterium]
MSFERATVLHVPVISRSYLDYLDSQSEVDSIHILDNSAVGEFDGIRKDLRKLEADEVVALLRPRLEVPVQTIGSIGLRSLIETTTTDLIMPDDEVSDAIVSRYNLPADRYRLEKIFLRWDRKNIATNVEVDADEIIETVDLPVTVREQLEEEINMSSDWWRQVGCVIFSNDGNLIVSSHNTYVPSDTSAEIDGDIRSQASRGISIDIANAQHAESRAIAIAARKGLVLEGASCVVSTFPCAVCAKIITDAGIKQVYFGDGYATADGLEILRAADIQVIKVNGLPMPDEQSRVRAVPYIKSSEKS